MERMYKHTDLFLTHTWRTDLHSRNNHARVGIVNEHLNRLGYLTWFDEKSMSGNIKAKMAEGVDFTKCVLVFVTEEYMKKIDADCDDNCKFEYDRALAQKTENNILCIVMEQKYEDPSKWFGKLKQTLGSCLFVKMTGDLSNKNYLMQQLQLVVEQLKSKGVVPSQTKNMCQDCTITNKNGKELSFFSDGKACTYCGENLKSTSEPKNYCVTCQLHSNGSFCHLCKLHLLDKNQRIQELKDQLLELISLESNVELTKYDVNTFQDKIDKMKNDLHLIETKRSEAQSNGLKFHINKKDYDEKSIKFQNEIDYLVNITDTLDKTKNKCSSLVPSFEEELKQFGKYMRTLDESRKEYLKHADNFSKTMKKWEEVQKQVSDFAITAMEGEKHVHGKSCSCDECVFERELTSHLISNARQYLLSLITANDIERVKAAIDVKSEIKERNDDNDLNLLLSLTVEHGTVEMLITLLKAGIYIDSEKFLKLITIGEEKNIFSKIITENKVEDLKLLIQNQQDILEAKNEHGGNIFLSITMRYGKLDLFIVLLEMGAQDDFDRMGELVNIVDENNFQTFRKIMHDNNVEGLRKIVELRSDITNVKDENGTNVLLLLTVQYGTLEMFNMLVENGCEADIVNTGDKTLLHSVKNTDIAKMLCMKHGDALLPVKDEYGRTPFMKVYLKNNTTMVETISPFVKVEEEMKEISNCFTLLLEEKGFNYVEKLISKNNITTMTILLTLRPYIVSWMDKDKGVTPFQWCCYNGSAEMLRLLVDNGSDVNKCDEQGRSALMRAIFHRKKEWCEEMVEYLCTTQPQLLTMKDNVAASVFHMAAYFNKERLVPILLKHSPPPQMLQKVDSYGDTPIEIAKRKGYEPIVQMYENYIKENEINITTETKEEEIKEINNCLTLLLEKEGLEYIERLIRFNNITTMTTLLTLKPDVVNMMDENNYTPFLHCCGFGSVKMLKLLVDRGADVNKCDKYGRTALMFAVQYNKTERCGEMVEYLCTTQPQLLTMKNGIGGSVFHFAAYYNREDLVPILLKHSPPPQMLQKVDSYGNTPIDMAKANGYEPIVQMYENYIKENKTNTTTEMKEEEIKEINSCLTLLLENEGLEYIERLIKFNNITTMTKLLTLKPDIVNMMEDNFTPFLQCCGSGSTEMLKLLVDRGADVNKCDKQGRNALMRALVHRKTEWCEEMVEYLCTTQPQLLTMKDNVAASVFHMAAYFNKETLVPILLKHSTPQLLEKLDTHGETPIDIAKKKGYEVIVQMYENYIKEKKTNATTEIKEEEIKEANDCLTLLMEKEGLEYIERLIKFNNITTMTKLITLKPDIVNMMEDNFTPFLQCCGSGSTEMLKLLVDRGADVNKCDEQGRSALMRAVVHNKEEWCEEMVEYLCTTQPQLLTMKDNVEASVFHLAAYFNKEKVIPILLKHSTPQLLEKLDTYGETPIDIAKKNGYEVIVQMYENYIKEKKTNATTEIKEEEIKEVNDCLTLLLEKEGLEYIERLIKFNNITTMTTLLTLKPDVVDMKDKNNYTPFLHCCGFGSTELLKLLVDTGSDVNKCNMYRNNALMIVVMFNKTEWCGEVVEYLCTTRPQLLTMEDCRGGSVFHFAAYYNREDLVPILLNYSPPPQVLEKKDSYGNTPIDMAKEEGYEPIVQIYEKYIRDNKAYPTTETK